MRAHSTQGRRGSGFRGWVIAMAIGGVMISSSTRQSAHRDTASRPNPAAGTAYCGLFTQGCPVITCPGNCVGGTMTFLMPNGSERTVNGCYCDDPGGQENPSTEA